MGENSGLSASDVLALVKDNDGIGGGNGMLIVLFLLIVLLGGNGFGNRGGFGEGVIPTSLVTQADLCTSSSFNGINAQLDNLARSVCDIRFENAQQTYALGSQLAQQGFGIQNNLMETRLETLRQTADIGMAIANLGFANERCCCETQKQIAAQTAENYRNTCDIKDTIRAEGTATRALITENLIQQLREENNTYKTQLAIGAQSDALLGALRPTPIPAYITASPYQSVNPCSYGYGYGYGYNGNYVNA